MRRRHPYVHAWLVFSTVMGALGYVRVAIEADPVLALVMVPVAFVVGGVAVAGKRVFDIVTGREPAVVAAARDVEGPGLSHLVTGIADPAVLGFYAAVGAIVVRAAGGPALVSAGLLALSVALLLGRRRLTTSAGRERRP